MRSVILMGLLGLAVCQLPDFDSLNARMNQLTSSLVGMTQQLDQIQSTRDVVSTRVGALNWLLDRRVGTFCGDNQYQCRSSVQCISGINVCDGVADCANGSDEDDCDVPFAVGDSYNIAFSASGSCNANLNNVVLTITSFVKNPWFPGRAKVDYMVRSTSDNSLESSRSMAVGSASYFYSRKQLLLGPQNSGTRDTFDFRALSDNQFAIMSYRIGNNAQCNRGVGTKA